jgi:enoyl-CoA hydratase/carnithine racemase
MSDQLKVERQGNVLVVTLNRPERMNALSAQIHEDLLETWTSLKTDRSVRGRSASAWT